MSPTRKRSPRPNHADDEIRDQEVLRANRELASYFRGRRTEREARAALKIVKAFIRHREHVDPANRRPLPGAAPVKASGKAREHTTAKAGKKARRRALPQVETSVSKNQPASTAPPDLE